MQICQVSLAIMIHILRALDTRLNRLEVLAEWDGVEAETNEKTSYNQWKKVVKDDTIPAHEKWRFYREPKEGEEKLKPSDYWTTDKPYKPEPEVIAKMLDLEQYLNFDKDAEDPHVAGLTAWRHAKTKSVWPISTSYKTNKFVVGDHECILTFNRSFIKLVEKSLDEQRPWKNTYYLQGYYNGIYYVPAWFDWNWRGRAAGQT